MYVIAEKKTFYWASNDGGQLMSRSVQGKAKVTDKGLQEAEYDVPEYEGYKQITQEEHLAAVLG